MAEEFGGLGGLPNRILKLFSWVGLSRAVQGSWDYPQTLQTCFWPGVGNRKEANRGAHISGVFHRLSSCSHPFPLKPWVPGWDDVSFGALLPVQPHLLRP